MSNSRFAVFGLCVALVACGEQFVAHPGSGADGGASGAGGGQAGAGAEASEAGTGGHAGSDHSAGAADAGNPAIGSGGVGGIAGIAGIAGAATGGTGGLLAQAGGGTTGLSGAGGALIEPMLPQLGLLLWLRADRGIQSRNGHVDAWQDQSGHQANARQVTANARPTYLPTGFNGRPTLDFDGQGQFLKFDAGFGDFSKGLAGFVVARPTKADCSSMLEFSNGSEVEDVALGMWENKWNYEVGDTYLQTGDVDLERFSLYAFNHRMNGTADLRIGGSVIGTLEIPLPAVPSSGARENNFVAHTLYGNGCEYFSGQISEIILYSRPLSASELTTIEKYLDAHWALAEQDPEAPAP